MDSVAFYRQYFNRQNLNKRYFDSRTIVFLRLAACRKQRDKHQYNYFSHEFSFKK
mgnify:CR=1 FL=1